MILKEIYKLSVNNIINLKLDYVTGNLLVYFL